MNQHESFRRQHALPDTILTPEQERQAFDAVKGVGGDKPLFIVSDFDGTLCNQFAFDPATNNHLPNLDPEIIESASRLPIILATGRRSRHPAIPHIQSSGLVDRETPIISENGGVLHTLHGAGFVLRRKFVSSEAVAQIMAWGEEISHNIDGLPDNRKFVTKPGDTILVARVQDDTGHSTSDDKQRLLDSIHDLGIPSGIEVVDCGQSLTIQSAEVSKATALAELLKQLGIMRDSISLVAVGNSPNDIPIFEQAELSVGVSPEVASHVDIAMSRGAESTKALLRFRPDAGFFDLRSLTRQLHQVRRDAFLHTGMSVQDAALRAFGWKI